MATMRELLGDLAEKVVVDEGSFFFGRQGREVTVAVSVQSVRQVCIVNAWALRHSHSVRETKNIETYKTASKKSEATEKHEIGDSNTLQHARD